MTKLGSMNIAQSKNIPKKAATPKTLKANKPTAGRIANTPTVNITERAKPANPSPKSLASLIAIQKSVRLLKVIASILPELELLAYALHEVRMRFLVRLGRRYLHLVSASSRGHHPEPP